MKPASTMFPLMEVVAAIQDTSTSISYGGIVTHDGERVYDIAVQETFQNDPGNFRGKITRAHIYVVPRR